MLLLDLYNTHGAESICKSTIKSALCHFCTAQTNKVYCSSVSFEGGQSNCSPCNTLHAKIN